MPDNNAQTTTYDKVIFSGITTITNFFNAIQNAMTGWGDAGNLFDITIDSIASNASNKTNALWQMDYNSSSYAEYRFLLRLKNPYITESGSHPATNNGIALIYHNHDSYSYGYQNRAIRMYPTYYTPSSVYPKPCTYDNSIHTVAFYEARGTSNETKFFSEQADTEYTLERYCLDGYSVKYKLYSSRANTSINFGFLAVKDMTGQGYIFVCGNNSWLDGISINSVPSVDSSSNDDDGLFTYNSALGTSQRVYIQTVNPNLIPKNSDLVSFIFMPFCFTAQTTTMHFYNLRFDNNKRLYVLCDSSGARSFTPGITVTIDGESYTSLGRIFKMVVDDTYEGSELIQAEEASF